jgi:hypothetical protein
MSGEETTVRDFVIEAIHRTFQRINVAPKGNARGAFLDPEISSCEQQTLASQEGLLHGASA